MHELFPGVFGSNLTREAITTELKECKAQQSLERSQGLFLFTPINNRTVRHSNNIIIIFNYSSIILINK